MQDRFFYCPVCGGELTTQNIAGGVRKVCSKCTRINFENPIVGAAAIILNERGEILLGKRSADTTYPGLWCIPCGYVEYNEDIRTAVVREAKEETGLEVACREVFAVHSNFHNPRQHTVGIWFLCDVVRGILTPGDDVCELGWYKTTNPPSMAFPTDYIVLKDLSNTLKTK